jgi:hypothetical protein
MMTSIVLTYECSPTIVWVRDAQQTLLVDRETGDSWILPDVEAMIWDWLSVGRSHEEIVQMLCLILELPVEEGVSVLSDVCEDWQGAGILRVTK